MFFKIKIITGTTGLLTAPDSVQGGSGVVTRTDAHISVKRYTKCKLVSSCPSFQ
ncbi:hypothetical protein HanIR_Chr17g0876691 [Helianthus annuus]|nr:hypothetical protein HanIR_Chr17g0876691 [Helianthus annuus]